MKYTLYIALFAFQFVVLGCEEEPSIQSKEYPYVITKEAVTEDNVGVTFIAELKDKGQEEIIDYGFIWTDYGLKFKYSLYDKKELENFKLHVTSDLEENIMYLVKAYVKTDKHMVYGNELTFKGDGCLNPEIVDFHPKSGDSGDTITIISKNTSLNKSRVHVWFGDDKARVLTVKKDEITVLLQDNLTKSGEVYILVKSGEKSDYADEPFIIQGHQITDFSPKTAIIGQTEVTIFGSGFKETADKNLVKLSGYEAEVLEATNNELVIKLPDAMNPGNYQISVTIDDKEFVYPELIEAVNP